MDRLSENKIVIIKRKTRLEDLIMRFNTVPQARFYIEHLGADFDDYIKENEKYNNTILKAEEILQSIGRVQVVDRNFLPNFIFGENDIVVAIGQDGLVANVLKYLSNQFLIGVNPDSSRWDGILLPFEINDLKTIVPEVFKNKRPVKEVTMAKASLNDGQTIYAVNDLYIGQKTHVSSRYMLKQGNKSEEQSSSGIIISTGLGSTGWLKSIYTGAQNIMNAATGAKRTLTNLKNFSWNSDYLIYSVREPFPSKSSQTNMVFGTVMKNNSLKILSQMPENGVIFSDGIESDYLSFTSGITATITIAEKKGKLVV